jgi:putative phosphoribosyl transferase
VEVGRFPLPGHLTVPADAVGVVAFAHGSGSSRHSPRNQFVADQLHAARLGTLTFDLLSDGEARDRRNVFDIGLLANRLARATDWVRHHHPVTAPTLLIVGGNDTEVLSLNRDAQRHLRCENRLTVVPGATHLFEEPGALQQVAALAAEWFVEHCRAAARSRR